MISLDTMEYALKEINEDCIFEILDNANPFLANVNHTCNDVWGKEIRKRVKHVVKAYCCGIADYDFGLLNSRLKNFYFSIEMPAKLIRDANKAWGAKILKAGIENMLEEAKFNFSRMLFGDGSGVLATVDHIKDGKIYLDTTKNISVGVQIGFYTPRMTTILHPLNIISIDRIKSSITVDGKEINNETIPKGSIVCVYGGVGKELTGFGAIFKTDGELYGLKRSEHKWLIPHIENNVGEITLDKVQEVIDYLYENAGSKVDFIICSHGVQDVLRQRILEREGNIDCVEIKGGYKAISYNGIPIVSDNFCPKGTMYLLNTKDFNFHQLCDWQWLYDEDGSIIKINANKTMYSATLVKYGDLMCSRPYGQAMLTDITEL